MSESRDWGPFGGGSEPPEDPRGGVPLPADTDLETESPELGPPDRVPRGWDERQWNESLYGTSPSRRAALSWGRPFLLSIVLIVVLIVLIVVILAVHGVL